MNELEKLLQQKKGIEQRIQELEKETAFMSDLASLKRIDRAELGRPTAYFVQSATYDSDFEQKVFYRKRKVTLLSWCSLGQAKEFVDELISDLTKLRARIVELEAEEEEA